MIMRWTTGTKRSACAARPSSWSWTTPKRVVWPTAKNSRRRRVLQLLMEAGQPVKAYDLISTFGHAGEGPAKPPTVYRALEFLERQGLVHRIESLSAYVACGKGQGGHAAAFLICDCCGKTHEIEAAIGEPLQQAARDTGFVLQSVAIEAHGRCAACRA
jgi:Fur family zinc uptake transcriptional regulator